MWLHTVTICCINFGTLLRIQSFIIQYSVCLHTAVSLKAKFANARDNKKYTTHKTGMHTTAHLTNTCDNLNNAENLGVKRRSSSTLPYVLDTIWQKQCLTRTRSIKCIILSVSAAYIIWGLVLRLTVVRFAGNKHCNWWWYRPKSMIILCFRTELCVHVVGLAK